MKAPYLGDASECLNRPPKTSFGLRDGSKKLEGL
jgi:hypothetical protein